MNRTVRHDLYVDTPARKAFDARAFEAAGFEPSTAAGSRHLTELHDKCFFAEPREGTSPTSVVPRKGEFAETAPATPTSLFTMMVNGASSGRLARVEEIAECSFRTYEERENRIRLYHEQHAVLDHQHSHSPSSNGEINLVPAFLGVRRAQLEADRAVTPLGAIKSSTCVLL